jgi:hypothetical protein
LFGDKSTRSNSTRRVFRKTPPLGANWPIACLIVFALTTLAGCGRGPSRVAAPTWDPEGAASRAIEMYDKDGDSKLSDEELTEVPGLKYCAKLLDSPQEKGDGDGLLSRDEILRRIQLYRDSRTAWTQFNCRVGFGGRPPVGAEVKLVPEPFLGEGILVPATGTVREDGSAMLDGGAEGIRMPVVRIGMYRVEVTSDRLKIPAKYNTATTLGVEVPPVQDMVSPSGVTFNMSTK